MKKFPARNLLFRILLKSDEIFIICMHSTLYKVKSIDVHCHLFHKLFQSPAELRNLHTIYTNKCTWIRSVYKLLIWRSRLWNLTVIYCVPRSYVATSFQTYKQINNWCKIKRVSVGMYSYKRSERKQKWNFEDPNSSLVGCGAVSNGKRRLSAGEYC
jgi:hypothetical protein